MEAQELFYLRNIKSVISLPPLFSSPFFSPYALTHYTWRFYCFPYYFAALNRWGRGGGREREKKILFSHKLKRLFSGAPSTSIKSHGFPSKTNSKRPPLSKARALIGHAHQMNVTSVEGWFIPQHYHFHRFFINLLGFRKSYLATRRALLSFIRITRLSRQSGSDHHFLEPREKFSLWKSFFFFFDVWRRMIRVIYCFKYDHCFILIYFR